MSSIRPDRLSMEGMIWNADHVLEQALNPSTNGIPKGCFERCIGILLISVVEAGFAFSGNVGTGILLKKKDDGTWSKPCAMGLGGVGWGLLVGAAAKDIIVFINDETSMQEMCAKTGLRLGGQVNVSLGPWGRSYDIGVGVSTHGASGTYSVAFSKGAFLGLSIEGAIINVRGGANDQFYQKVTTPTSILLQDDVDLPTDRPTLLQNVYDKLQKVQAGTTSVPTAEETAAKQSAAEVAQKASDEVAASDPSVVKVNAEEEAKKEEEEKQGGGETSAPIDS